MWCIRRLPLTTSYHNARIVVVVVVDGENEKVERY